MRTYVSGIPPTTRSSLLIDLSQGKRIEVEALQGSVVRRGQAKGVSTPIMASLYAVLKPHAAGPPVVLGS
jgi:2-dehydropantoate 2-reductase